ncbi:Brp/Blh family beta-carotene 15,15'-dioxygenase [Litorimonas sp. RW-G-Af-16]|uniref:Brp/Blh family beta-carotene 15,15'-dioxygenase n=1 Tax=Litorimonas sp. RW-G-Af-16 TaxID=3241168 RepID=UPI00390CC4E4
MRGVFPPAFWVADPSGDTITSQHAWLKPAIATSLILIIANAVSPIAANWIAIIFFLFGVPHGAVERTQDRPRFIMPTLAYSALYIVFGILVFSSWLISPLGTLVIFFLLSAWHFGQSEPTLRLIGAWVIIGSCLIYPVETVGIFALLIEQDPPPSYIADAMHVMAIACGLAVFLEFVLRAKAGQMPSVLRLVFLIGIFLILPPVPAVAVYFFAFHGLGEFSRTIASVSRAQSDLKPLDVLKLYGPATFPAMIGAVLILTLTYQGHIPVLIATGLAVSFIIPHMLPVEALLRVDRETTRTSP